MSLDTLEGVINRNAHKCLHTVAEYKQHLKFGWKESTEWQLWDRELSIKSFKDLVDVQSVDGDGTPSHLRTFSYPMTRKPSEEKTINEEALYHGSAHKFQYKHADNIGTCLKHLLESHNQYADITVSKDAIEEYMRHVFMHRISLTRLQRFIKDGVIDHLAEHHKMFFFSWLRISASYRYLNRRCRTLPDILTRSIERSHYPQNHSKNCRDGS